VRLDPKIDFPLLGSAIAVGVVAAAREATERFRYGSEIGDVVFDLGIAYLSAWVFHLLIVRLPDERRRRAFLASIGPELAGLSDVGKILQRQIEDQSNTAQQTFPADRELVKEMCEGVHMDAPSGMLRWPLDEDQPKSLTWAEFLRSTSELTSRLQRDLAALYQFMDDDLVLLLQGERVARLHKHRGLFNARQMGDTSLSWTADEIFEYLEIAGRIETYRKKHVSQFPASASASASA
jgi:hypothetical protein